MKARQITAVFFCVLVSSTLGHEYLRAKQYGAPSGRSKLISPFEERVSNPAIECTFVCHHNGTTTPGSSLKLIINSTSELIAIFNTTGEVSLVIDVTNEIVALFNGTSGAIILINIEKQIGLYISAGETSSTWLNSDECFTTYFQTLTSLEVFFRLNVGTTFNLKSVSTAIITVIGRLLSRLSSEIAIQIQQDASISLQILLKIGSAVIGLLKGSLKGILHFANRTIIHLAGDLTWFVNVLQGISIIVSSIEGGLEALIIAKVEFDLSVLFAAENGLELLINILLSIVSHINLSALGNLLNNIGKILEVIVKLGGNVAHGVTGVFKVIWYLYLLIQGSIEIGTFIDVLIIFYHNKNNSETIKLDIYLGGLVDLLKIQNSTHGSTQSIAAFSSLITHLQNGTWTISGVNISSVINILTGTVENVLKSVVNILLLVTSVVQIVVSIPTLLFYLIHLLLSSEGTKILLSIIPSLKNKISSSGSSHSSGNILLKILSAVGNLLSQLSSNLFSVLETLPVVGSIVSALGTALKNASKGKLTLNTIYKSSYAKTIFSQIKVFLKAISSKQNYTLPWSNTTESHNITYVTVRPSSNTTHSHSTNSSSSSGHWIWHWPSWWGHGPVINITTTKTTTAEEDRHHYKHH